MAISPICDEDERFARAAWSTMTEPGDVHAGYLVAALGHVVALNVVRSGAVADSPLQMGDSIPREAEQWRARFNERSVRDALAIAAREGFALVDPLQLAGMADLGARLPHVLWVRGDITALEPTRNIAIVGARAATSYGEHVCAELASGVVADGVSVHSGAAYGIDGAAHRAALSAGGDTVAWLAGGVDRPYPAGHHNLLDCVASSPGSAVVSELPPRSTPTRWRFTSRNRLIAAASRAVVVVGGGRSVGVVGHRWYSGGVESASRGSSRARDVGGVGGLSCVASRPQRAAGVGRGRSFAADAIAQRRRDVDAAA